jgi:hypothetical protein
MGFMDRISDSRHGFEIIIFLILVILMAMCLSAIPLINVYSHPGSSGDAGAAVVGEV